LALPVLFRFGLTLCYAFSNIKSWADDAQANLPPGKVDSRELMWLPIGSNQTEIVGPPFRRALCYLGLYTLKV